MPGNSSRLLTTAKICCFEKENTNFGIFYTIKYYSVVLVLWDFCRVEIVFYVVKHSFDLKATYEDSRASRERMYQSRFICFSFWLIV